MLTASINFNRDPIFLAGETVQVEMALENESSSDDESLAICTGQLSCRCAVNGNKVNKDLMESQLTQLFSSASPQSGNRSPKSNYEIGSNTAFNIAQGEKGYSVFCTDPEIIFCDLKLLPQECNTFNFAVNIPLSSHLIAPSFSGSFVRFTYRLVFGFQRVGRPVQLLKCPIRVLVLCGKTHGESLASICDIMPRSPADQTMPDTGGKPAGIGSNPFLSSGDLESSGHRLTGKEREDSLVEELELLMQTLACKRNLNGRSTPVAYSVRQEQIEIAKFSLSKNCFRIGEEINGVFDFNGFPKYCLQYTVNLQCEEKLMESFKLESSTAGTQIHLLGSKCEYVADVSQTELSIPIPHSVCPSFSTDMVHLSWSLQFTFVIATESHPDIASKFINTSFDDENDDQIVNYTRPSNYETFSWSLPITVLPNSPFKLQNCSSALKRSHSLILQ